MSDRTWNFDGRDGPGTLVPFSGEYAVDPATDADIAHVTEISGLRLPSVYEHYLRTVNGGTAEPDDGFDYRYDPDDLPIMHRCLPPDDEILAEPRTVIAEFLAATHPRKGLGIEASLRHTRRWTRPAVLPIASTDLGDILVLDLEEGDRYGSVEFLTLHGVGALEGTGIDVPLAHVAESFEAFLQGLYDLESIMEERAMAVIRRGKGR